MVAIMAMGGYGYDPTALKSSVAKEIADDGDTQGRAIDDGTVLKWLKEASEEFPIAKPTAPSKPKSV